MRSLAAAGPGRPSIHLLHPRKPAAAPARPRLPCRAAAPDDPLAALGLAPPPLDGDLETLQAAAGAEVVVVEDGNLTSFGSDAAAARALKSEAGVALVDAGGWTVLRIGGPGAAAFLHAQSTADFLGRPDLKPGTTVRTSFTTPTAGCLATGVALVQEGGSILLLLGPGGPAGDAPPGIKWGGSAVARKLTLAASLPPADGSESVSVDDVSARCAVFGLCGPGSGAALAKLGARAAAELPLSTFTMLAAGPGAAPVFVLAGTGLASVAGFTLVADRDSGGAADLWAALSSPAIGAIPAGSALWHAARVEDGAPAPGSELDGKHTPFEAGLGSGWVSVAKGCYLGAEALTKVAGASGRLKSELWGLRIAAPPGVRPVAGDAVVVDGKDGESGGPAFGRLSSIAPVLPGGAAAAGGGALALAFLSPNRAPGGADALKPGLRVSVACSGGSGGEGATTTAAAVVEALPHAERTRPPLAEKKKKEEMVAVADAPAAASPADAAAARAAKLAAMKARLDAWQAEQQKSEG